MQVKPRVNPNEAYALQLVKAMQLEQQADAYKKQSKMLNLQARQLKVQAKTDYVTNSKTLLDITQGEKDKSKGKAIFFTIMIGVVALGLVAYFY